MDTPRYRRNLTPPHYTYIDLTPELPPLSRGICDLERLCIHALDLLWEHPSYSRTAKRLWREVCKVTGRQVPGRRI